MYAIRASRAIKGPYKSTEALQFSQFAIDRSADASFWIGSDGRLIYVNDAACKSLGYERAELLSMAVHDIDPHFPRGKWQDHWKTLREKKIHAFDSYHKTKDGRIVPVEIRSNYLEFQGRQFNYASARDLSERRRSEEERARLSNELQQAYQEITTLHSITTTANESLELEPVLEEVIEKITERFQFDATRIFLLNSAREELHLKASFEVTPGLWAQVRVRPRGKGISGYVIETGEPVIFEDLRKDDRYEEINCSSAAKRSGFRFFAVFPIKSRQKSLGTIVCAGRASRQLASRDVQLLLSIGSQIGVSLDTQNKAQVLEKLNVELQEANYAKTHFLEAMSHELRTPLHVITGYNELLRGGAIGEVNEEQRKALETTRTHAQILLKLISDVLTLTKIGTKKLALDISATPLSETLKNVCNYSEQIGRNDRLEISFTLAGSLPSITTDHPKLEAILQNLISNAYKFTEEGRIEVRVRTLREQDRVEFSIADTGLGIDEVELGKVFQPFYQGQDAHKGELNGVGLGLCIVKTYLELMEGELQITSERGAGTTVTFSLPFSVSQ
jgi:PAS domain S-box-containing protein